MRPTRLLIIPLLMVFLLVVGIVPSIAGIFVQCPGDTDGDLIPDQPGYENVVCKHITGGDGFVKMADGADSYVFSFGEVDQTVPGFNLARVVTDFTLKAMTPAPRIELDEGQELYLTLTNVGMAKRQDLFDPHSVHWHGFPNAAPIFDGLPEPSTTPIMGGSFTYYYNAAVPGTYFYHCHVEAAEHMQMGMIGNLWVNPAQNGNTAFYPSGQYAYNDDDGSTGYDVAYPVQITAFDSKFHEASLTVQPLPFADMYDDYPMINGRGYPDTINTDAAGIVNQDGFKAQPVHTLITADSGQRILLRVSNVSTTHLYTVATTLGVPMKVVGRGAALLRGPTGLDTSYEVSVLNVGGGQAFDVIVDTTGVPAGTYFLYTTNLSDLSNGNEDRGGLMTEIVINS